MPLVRGSLRFRGRLTASRTVSALALLTLLASLPVLAAPKLQTFHIDAGDATLTLNEFSRQSSLQLLFDYNIVRGRKTRAVSGELTAETALRQMLVDTGLVFDFVNERTLAVTLSGPAGGPGSAVAEASPRPPSRTQAAEAQNVLHAQPGSGDLRIDPRAVELEEITILGTHVRGEEPVGEHVVHLGREDINPNPAGTVQDLLRTIPQTFGGGPTEDTHYFDPEARTNSGIGSGINLRGLGAGATLILIDGKRMAPSGTEGSFSDVENIPLAAVERVDILSDGASALYGSDAVGGVVNFVMRDNFTGSESLVRGGSGTQSTLQEYRAAQTLGSRWDSGSGMVSLEYYQRGDLPAYARRYANSDLTSLGGSNFDIPQANPGNILTAGGQTFAIPAGQNGTHLSAGNLVAGTQNLTNQYDGAQLLPSQQRWSLYGSGKQALNDTVSLFGNALLSRRDAQEDSGGLPAILTVPNTNPFYPSGLSGPIRVEYNFLDDLGSKRADVAVYNFNATLGLNISVGTAWQMTLYGNYAQEKENQLTTGLASLSTLSAALADPNPARAFNPFGDGSHTNPATLGSIAASDRYYTNSNLRTVNATLDGPIGRLPGGDIKLALGLDRCEQIFATKFWDGTSGSTITENDSRNITAAFSELRIPLFGRENGRNGYRRLELSIAGRYENYSGFGHAATPKLGLAWSPVDALAFHGTWGRSVRAPTPAELNTRSNSIGPLTLPDRLSPTRFSTTLIEAGNSPNVTVERARSWTAGFDVDAAQWVPGLTLSATYFNINFRNRIQEPTTGLYALNDPSLASLITRNPTPAEIDSACSTGGLYVGPAGSSCSQYPVTVLLDARRQNLTSVRTSGIDLGTIYERRWTPGTLRARLDGTYLLDFKQQATPDASAVQLLNTQNNPINIKLRGMLTWQQVRWGATLAINFQNHYRDTLSEPNRNISSLTTFDSQLRYSPTAFGAGWLQNTVLELNAVNLFNVSPPFLNNATAGLGYDQENADPTGRLLSIQVRKSW